MIIPSCQSEGKLACKGAIQLSSHPPTCEENYINTKNCTGQCRKPLNTSFQYHIQYTSKYSQTQEFSLVVFTLEPK